MSALLQPVVRDGTVLGVVALAWQERLERLPEAVSAMMSLLAAEAAVALTRTELLARLREAGTDELTGVLTLAAWNERLERELERAGRTAARVSVVKFELDDFEQLDERDGGGSRDALRRQAAAAWLAELRLTDSLGHCGRDAFMALLPGCSPDDALGLAVRLGAALPGGVTCSCGAATWGGCEAGAELVARAAEALRAAKHGGRSNVVASA